MPHSIRGDDYLTKPFDTEELLARIRVALRHRSRSQTGDATVLTGEVTIDLTRRHLRRGDAEVTLNRKEYDPLAELARHPSRVVTHAQLLRTVSLKA